MICHWQIGASARLERKSARQTGSADDLRYISDVQTLK